MVGLPHKWEPTKLQKDSEILLKNSAMSEVPIEAGGHLHLRLFQYLHIFDPHISSHTLRTLYSYTITVFTLTKQAH